MVQSPQWLKRSSVSNRSYRLIDDFCEPHPQLDSCYASLDEALAEAIHWLQQRPDQCQDQLIGVEVSSANGDWRTCRLPAALLCALRS